MQFSHQTRGTMAQVLTVTSDNAARTFVYKHLGIVASQLPPPRALMQQAEPDSIFAMLLEMLARPKILRAGAPVKHVFDDAIDELRRWALHDGFAVEDGQLVRVTPLAEEITGIRDKLTDDLASRGLDSDGTIRKALDDSANDFVAVPPDFNGSITKARIVLETVARRGAAHLASGRRLGHSDDSWGKALAFLRHQAVIDLNEEQMVARIYTFISPGAHVPKGISAEEWARLARSFAVSSAYFLLRKIAAA
jgi:hypothetical protein